MRIAAIIVTCNRKQMLNALLEDLLSQSRRPDDILVIDNASEDGTPEFVKSHYHHVHLLGLEKNSGLFGGLEIGTMTAIREGCDAVWLIDDDARLKKDALENLLNTIDSQENLRESVVWCANISPDGQFFTEPVCIKVNEEWRVYHRFLPELHGRVYETTFGPNIGIYIPRSVIEHIGPPRADMVFCGEQEFIYRVQKTGIKMYRCFSSITYHKRHKFSSVKFMGRTRYVSHVETWHTYYEIRNRIYVDLTYKRRSLPRSLLNTAVDSIVKIYTCDSKISTAIHIFRAVYDGILRRTGMRVRIPRPTISSIPEPKHSAGNSICT
jgi:GT2 family glycosyltransferase